MADFATTKRTTVGKLEGTPGTAETLADADMNVRAEGIEFTPDIAMNDEASKVATGGFIGSEVVHGAQSLSGAFTTKGALGADLLTAPHYWKMLEGCGLTEITYAATGIALQDLPSGDLQTMTLGQYEMATGPTPVGILDKMSGAMGNAVMSVANVGMPLEIAYDFKGKYAAQQDLVAGTAPVMTAPDTSVAEPFLNATVTVGAFSACLGSFTYDLGNTIVGVPCQSDPTGWKYFIIRSRNPNIQMSFLRDTISNYGSLAKTVGEVVEPINIAWGDNTWVMPRTQILTPALADGDGTVMNQMSYKLLENAGTDSDIDDRASFEWLIGARA